MSPWLLNVYMDKVMKEVKMGMGVRFTEVERERRLPGLLCADDLGLCGNLEKELRQLVEYFVFVCVRRGLKLNAGKSKVMVLKREKGLEDWSTSFMWKGCDWSMSVKI